MITKKYAIIALLGIGALVSVPMMADASLQTWLGVDCSTLKAGMVPICGDLNILKDLHIDVIEADVEALQLTDQTEIKMAMTVLEDSNDPECEFGLTTRGWCPNGMWPAAMITDPSITGLSFVLIQYIPVDENDSGFCELWRVGEGWFEVQCAGGIPQDGSSLMYMIVA